MTMQSAAQSRSFLESRQIPKISPKDTRLANRQPATMVEIMRVSFGGIVTRRDF